MSTAVPAGENVARPTTRTVLLVDDEEIVRLALSRMLRSLGFTVEVAADPDAALALMAHDAPAVDLLVTDVVMPGMNGRQLAERLRADRPDLPVVFMSAFVPQTAFPDGRLLDGSRFLLKPFAREDLEATIEAVLAA